MPDASSAPFEPVVDAHWASILKLAYRMTGDANEAEEIAQQTFFLAYRAWSRFEQRSSVATWLFRIAANQCKRHLLERQRQNSIPLEQAPPLDTRDQDPFESREAQERLDRALQAIRPGHRLVLTLFCLDELDHASIAEVLGCPIGTVWSRLFHARAALARHLEKEVFE